MDQNRSSKDILVLNRPLSQVSVVSAYKAVDSKALNAVQAEKEDQNGSDKSRMVLNPPLSQVSVVSAYKAVDLNIQEHLIPAELPKSKINCVYASEAELLNMALFGMTAKEWRDKNPELQGNIRDYGFENRWERSP